MYVVGGTVQQGTSQTFGSEHLSPLVEGEDCWSAARAGNICFAHPAAKRLMKLAADDDILVWADSGRVRVSVHAFADTDDIARFLDKLPQYLRTVGGPRHPALQSPTKR